MTSHELSVMSRSFQSLRNDDGFILLCRKVLRKEKARAEKELGESREPALWRLEAS